MWTDGAFVDPYLVARQLPREAVTVTSWPGKNLITRATVGMPHRFDRLGFLWAATQAAHSDECTFDLAEVGAAFGIGWHPTEAAACLRRIAYSTIEVTRPDTVSATTVDVSFLWPFETLELVPGSRKGRAGFGNLFCRDSLIPVHGDVIRRLVRSLPRLDLYLWQVTTAWIHREKLPLILPLDEVLSDLACCIRDRATARYRCKGHQKVITEVWPDCPHEIDGKTFVLNDGGFASEY